jgi:hypothetical protein
VWHHRSGRARLRHPVRPRAGWQRGRRTSAEAGRAPRTLAGEVTVTGYEATECSPCCPSPGPPVAAPFPALGPSRRVPQLQRYYGAVRLPVPLSPRFVAFAWRYPAVCLWFRSRRSRTPNRGPGVRIPAPTSGHCRREALRASQGSRTTHCPFALFFDPGRTEHARPSRRVGMAPAMSTTKAPTIIQLSRLNRTASGLAVYASSDAVTRTRRKTRFRPLAKRYRTGLVTRRVVTKGF